MQYSKQAKFMGFKIHKIKLYFLTDQTLAFILHFIIVSNLVFQTLCFINLLNKIKNLS